MIDTASRALISLGCFVGVGSLLMLPLTEPGSATRIVCGLSLLLGLAIVAGAAIARMLGARRRADPRHPHPDLHDLTFDLNDPTLDRHREDAGAAPHDEAVVTTKENR